MAAEKIIDFVLTANDKTGGAFSAVDKKLKTLSSGLASVQTKLLGLAGAAGFGLLIAKGTETGELFVKLNQSLGIPLDKLQVLQGAAALTGTSMETLGKASVQLSGVIQESLTGKVTPATEALKRLGISADDLRPIANDTTAVIGLVSGKISEMGSGLERTGVAADLLGKKLALEMTPFLLEGSEAMQQTEADLDAFGAKLTGLDISNAELLGDQFDRVKTLATALGTQIAGYLGPRVSTILDLFRDTAKESRGLGDDGLAAGVKIDAAMAAAIHTVQTLSHWFTFAHLEAVKLKAFFIGFNEANLNPPKMQPGSSMIDALVGAKTVAQQTAPALSAVQKQIAELEAQLQKELTAPDAGQEFLDRLEAKLKQLEAEAKARENALSKNERDPVDTAGDEAKAKAAEAARKAAEAKEAAERKASQAIFDRSRDEIQALEEKFMSEEDLLRSHKEREQAMIDEAEVLGVISHDKAIELKLASDAQYAADALNIKLEAQQKEDEAIKAQADERNALLAQLGGFQQQSIDDVLNASTVGFEQTTKGYLDIADATLSALAGHSKAAFKAEKLVAIGRAIINVHEGITKAMTLPWPLNFAVGAAIAASGVAQIAAIKSAQPGGGGGGISVGGGGGGITGSSAGNVSGSAADTSRFTATTQTQKTSITLVGDVFDRAMILKLIEGMNDAAKDNANIQFVVNG